MLWGSSSITEFVKAHFQPSSLLDKDQSVADLFAHNR